VIFFLLGCLSIRKKNLIKSYDILQQYLNIRSEIPQKITRLSFSIGPPRLQNCSERKIKKRIII